MQEECGGGGSLNKSSIVNPAAATPPVTSAGGTSPGPPSDHPYSTPQPYTEATTPSSAKSSTSVGVGEEGLTQNRLPDNICEVQGIVGNVDLSSLNQSVASLWTEEEQCHLLSSLPSINGSIGFGGSPHLFGNAGLGRLGANQSIQQQQQQHCQREVVAGPTAQLAASSSLPTASGNFLGNKVSTSWTSGIGHPSTWSTGGQVGLVGSVQGQVNPSASSSWRGRPTNMPHNLSNIRGISTAQACQNINIGKMTPANVANNIKFRRSTSFPNKTGLPQHSPYGHSSGQMPGHMQNPHLAPSFEITRVDDPRDYLQFQVSILC